ncbi:MAG TPA: transporter substrate-binding domain-containing protein, partial [Spirochaetota bacterium]|nr:transporter substrate-binding domain-containing protein [Spirochaetota bacterium]
LIEIAEVIFKKHKHNVDYKVMPWSRAISEAEKGKINAIAGAYYEDAPDFLFPKNEQGKSRELIFTGKNKKIVYNGINSLYSITLGVVKDYSYGDEIDQYILKNKDQSNLIYEIAGENSLESLLKMLKTDRIGALIENEIVMQNYLFEKKMENDIVPIGVLRDEVKVFIAFSPAIANSKTYAEILSSGMGDIRKTGELKQILAKYGLKDWK